jgi:hypothetical protein
MIGFSTTVTTRIGAAEGDLHVGEQNPSGTRSSARGRAGRRQRRRGWDRQIGANGPRLDALVALDQNALDHLALTHRRSDGRRARQRPRVGMSAAGRGPPLSDGWRAGACASRSGHAEVARSKAKPEISAAPNAR